jgi:hypothetical protein
MASPFSLALPDSSLSHSQSNCNTQRAHVLQLHTVQANAVRPTRALVSHTERITCVPGVPQPLGFSASATGSAHSIGKQLDFLYHRSVALPKTSRELIIGSAHGLSSLLKASGSLTQYSVLHQLAAVHAVRALNCLKLQQRTTLQHCKRGHIARLSCAVLELAEGRSGMYVWGWNQHHHAC